MKTLQLSEFKLQWLKNRTRICALPTQFVYPDYYTHKPFDIIPKLAYGYRINRDDMAPIYKKGENWQSYTDWVAIELHENYGADGHVDYIFRVLFLLVPLDELPKDTEEYLKLVSDYYVNCKTDMKNTDGFDVTKN